MSLLDRKCDLCGCHVPETRGIHHRLLGVGMVRPRRIAPGGV